VHGDCVMFFQSQSKPKGMLSWMCLFIISLCRDQKYNNQHGYPIKTTTYWPPFCWAEQALP
jgi:hypothetical protein